MANRTTGAILSFIAAAALAATATAESGPGVTDLSGANVQAIETEDILDALAVPRGTRIEPSAPPTVRLPIFFEFNSTQLQPGAPELLDKVGAALSSNELETFRFSIEGHTDSVGSSSYNEQLSKRRADAVREYLVAKGVPENRMEVVGHGEAAPVDSNDTDRGRQRNRRVELINMGATAP